MYVFNIYHFPEHPGKSNLKKMKNNQLFATIIFLIFCLSFSSCKKSETDNGLSEDIQNLVPDSLLQVIIDLGMPINEGITPPDIENIYKASPFELAASNRAGDYVGHLFSDLNIQFTNQDNDNLTVTVNYVNGPEVGNGLGSFISGSGNKFSVFVEQVSYIGSSRADLVQIISGTKTSSGIKDFYYALFMINNYGNPGGKWIEIGEGRIIHDSDGNSPIVASLNSSIMNPSVMSNQSIFSPIIVK